VDDFGFTTSAGAGAAQHNPYEAQATASAASAGAINHASGNANGFDPDSFLRSANDLVELSR